MTDSAYLVLSGVLPIVWALAGAILFRRLDARRDARARVERAPPGDYSI